MPFFSSDFISLLSLVISFISLSAVLLVVLRMPSKPKTAISIPENVPVPQNGNGAQIKRGRGRPPKNPKPETNPQIPMPVPVVAEKRGWFSRPKKEKEPEF